MRPSLLTPERIDDYLAAGHWSRDTLVDLYAAHAAAFPDRLAVRDAHESFTWSELGAATDRLAAALIDLGLPRDSTALVQMPSSCREVVIRLAFKKAGIIGAFAPMQWRRRELDYVWGRISPALIVMTRDAAKPAEIAWLDEAVTSVVGPVHRLDLSDRPAEGWLGWRELLETPLASGARDAIADRRFAFDEVSLITVSSGTSGLGKLCEWPEGAQICMGRVLGDRMAFTADDRVGVFAPMSGAAGLVVWLISAATPCSFTFPQSYDPDALLGLVAEHRLTVGTTVPVILARLARATLENRDLSSLRMVRVGTAAADMDIARSFESLSGCKVVIASGSMECTGFGHAHVNEPADLRLNGSVGLPLEGCRLRIDDDNGDVLPPGTIGELKVSAPFASSGYWNDAAGTAAVWSDGWYATGDLGVLDAAGRLTLKGRIKELINRSGLKILPSEIETEIAKHPDVLECAVVAAPDPEYGEVPWAFVQLRDGADFDAAALSNALSDAGIPAYKIPDRIVRIVDFPRVSDNKIDKKALLESAVAR